MTYSIRLFSRAGSALIVPDSLRVTPLRWSAVARGGGWDAQIAALGDLGQLAGLTAWLGCTLDIVNAAGTAVWSGDIAAVEIVSGGLRRGATLERLANRAQVRYSQTQAGGAAAAADTAWTDDANSQARYGVYERRFTPSREMTAGAATAYRAQALARLALPQYSLAIDDGEEQATIYCTGYWQRCKRLYYSQPLGVVQHTASGAAAALGLGLTSDRLAFAARTDTIHSVNGRLGAFLQGMRARVSGASNAGNNASWLIASGGDTRAAVAYTSTGVTWSANDDIADSNGGLGFLAQDDVFSVSGATNAIHNGTHILDKPGSVAIESNNTYHGAIFTSESPGANVVFSRGNAIKVTGSLTNEHLGALAGSPYSVTITAWGEKHYQPFTLPATGIWTAAAVEIRLRRVGSPADSVTVQLVADSSGSPGTAIESASVAAANIPTEMGWVSFAMSNTNVLNSNNAYGLVVSRSGANDYDDYYEIDLDSGATYAGGALRQWDGAAWQTPDPAQDMIFRVLGADDTGNQIEAMLNTLGWIGVDVSETNIDAAQYRDGELRVIDELDTLLDMGTSDGYALLARTYANRSVSVYRKPAQGAARWSYAGGQLLDMHGRPAPDGYLPAGEWVHLADGAGLGPWAGLSPVFVDRAEFDAAGGRLTLEPEGAGDIFETGARQG